MNIEGEWKMNWGNHDSYIELYPPLEFNFNECLVFLGRSNLEIMHQIKESTIYKLLAFNQTFVIIKIGCYENIVRIDFPLGKPSEIICKKVAGYVWEWFDLDKDLSHFYKLAHNEKVLRPLVQKYYGLRINGIPDLFEALTWAIMGQQINLTFAYTLKRRFVEHYGEKLEWNGEVYWLYPTPQKIALLQVKELKKLQFTTRKAEYIIDLAKEMTNGSISKESILQIKEYEQQYQSLMSIRGVGAWTADYVMMKCFQRSIAFPIADVGLHNALKLQLGLLKKPTITEIKELAVNWEGWQAYATFYLWRSLYEEAI